MYKNFLPLLFPDSFQKTSNLPDFSLSSNKFTVPWSENPALAGANSKVKNKDPSGGNTEDFFGRRWYEEVWWSHLWSAVDLYIVYIREFILWLHQGKFVKVKWVKIPSLAPLKSQVSKYIMWSNVHEPLKNITYIGKKIVF